MNVVIYDLKSGNLIGQYQIIVHGLNYESKESDAIELAYKNLVEDGLSGNKKMDQFRFVVTS